MSPLRGLFVFVFPFFYNNVTPTGFGGVCIWLISFLITHLILFIRCLIKKLLKNIPSGTLSPIEKGKRVVGGMAKVCQEFRNNQSINI